MCTHASHAAGVDSDSVPHGRPSREVVGDERRRRVPTGARARFAWKWVSRQAAPWILLIFLLADATKAQNATATETAPEITAGRSSGAIHLDGVLDEPAWASAGIIADLVQQDPRPGGSTPYHTEVRILVDADTLYLGITCSDPDPPGIVAHTMQRDGDFSGDDTVALVLDPFGDRRNGYYFRVNSLGARLDGLISQASDISLDWDGIWDARTRKTAEGWVAEISIPARTLRFAPGLPAWGFNVERVVARDRVTLRWSGTSHDSVLNDLRRVGELRGVAELKQGLGISLSPYGLTRYSWDLEVDDAFLRGDAGVDLTCNLTPGLAAVATVNTDFAETEVDTQQINLTRFPLFFPEKRAFFLEGSNLFEFGLDLGSDFIPFFSRTVGLFNGEPVPIDAGAKILGRAGPWGVAAMDVITGSTPSAPGTNLFAGRFTYDAGSHLRLGALGTRGNPDGVGDNAFGGMDAVWKTSTFRGDKNLAFAAWGARSGGDSPPGDRNGWGASASYPNDRWDLSLSVNQYGDALDPALGFLPRPGTRFYRGGMAFQPRPAEDSSLRWVRQFFFEIFPLRVDDLNGNTESWQVRMAPFNIETRTGENFEVNVAPQFERLTAPFEIFPGVIIPVGEYHFTRYLIEMESSSHYPFSVGNLFWFGDFYDGRLSQWQPFLNYSTPEGHLQLNLSAESDYGHLSQGSFVERLYLLKTVYAFSSYLLLSVFTQYENNCPEEVPGVTKCRNLGLNSRLRWTLHPGNDLFVVWNRNWNGLGTDGNRVTLGPKTDSFVVKLRWTFRK